MTSLAEFTPYYLRMLWREGDLALELDLPRLVKDAENRISRDLRDANSVGVQAATFVGAANEFVLPADFREAISVDFATNRLTRAVSPDVIISARHGIYSPYDTVLDYSIFGGKLHIINTNNLLVTATITYFMGIAPFSLVDGEPSFYDRHSDFFIAALNSQTYSYLRDFDLAAHFESKYAQLLEDMRRESLYILYPSGQFPSPLSGIEEPTAMSFTYYPAGFVPFPSQPVTAWGDIQGKPSYYPPTEHDHDAEDVANNLPDLGDALNQRLL